MSEIVPQVPAFEPPLNTMGDIAVGPTWVQVPAGRYPLRGTSWHVTDMSQTQESISTVGIVLAILFFWVCFLGLLFLLMKERKVTGFVQLTVQGQGFHHAAMLPPGSFMHAESFANYARSLAAQA